ncbi:MAG: hypothetical protein D6798_12750 [Deltaproteobacteria bacterium]|nr:MAG: hypothetical protein D6798_12750 [Deltaproteobacteria bacterium]
MGGTGRMSPPSPATGRYAGPLHAEAAVPLPPEVTAGTPMGDLLRRAWQPVYREVDLPPGRAVGLQVLGERWTLFRTASGRPGMVAAACPHRGTALHLGRVEGERLVCMHHGWSFDDRGACTHRPDGGACAGAGVRAAPVRSHLGLLFAWLGDGPPAELPRWPAFEEPGTLRVISPERWPCPFGLRVENSLDLAHLPTTHAASGVGALAGPPAAPQVRLLADGLRVEGDAAAPVPLRIRCLLPNALCFPTPIDDAAGWRDHLVWRVPIDRHSCVSFTVTHVPATVPGHEGYAKAEPCDRPLAPSRVARLGASVLAGEVHLDQLQGEDNLTEVEDYVALCGILRDDDGRPLEGERLGPHDGPIRALRARWTAAQRGDARVWAGLPAPEHDGTG